MKAIYNNTVLAKSDEAKLIDGSYYFPKDSIDWSLFEKTERVSTCPWKGVAEYYSIKAGGELYSNGAWAYPSPKEGFERIAGHVAFYGKVKITNE